MLQNVYFVRCPNPKCEETIALPRQSQLGTFEYPHCQPTDEWPIDFQCISCASVFFVPVEAIHLGGIEERHRSLPYLWRYEFATVDTHSIRKYSIYAKALMRRSNDVLIEGMLKPTGKWKPEHGDPRFVGFYPLLLR
jgi:hypothetical protein